jgi:5'-3' exonuclease
MGIRNLFSFLKRKHPQCFHAVHISSFAFKKIGVDVMGVLYMYKAQYPNEWLTYVVLFLSALRDHYIHPVCFFDGPTHPLKQQTTEKRQAQRNLTSDRVDGWSRDLEQWEETRVVTPELDALATKLGAISIMTGQLKPTMIREYIDVQRSRATMTFTSTEIARVKELLGALGIACIDAPHDAEDLASQYCKEGIVETVLTNDSDVFALGCPSALTQFSKTMAYQVFYDEILAALDLTPQQFTDFCILCGTDFNTPIPMVGIETSLKWIRTYGSIEECPIPAEHRDALRSSELRSLFSSSGECRPVQYCTTSDTRKLSSLLFRYNLRLRVEQVSTNPSKLQFE